MGNANSDEQLKALKLEILRTQKYLARVQMGQLYKEFQDRLCNSNIDAGCSSLLMNEIAIELEEDITKLKTSTDPIAIATTFDKKCFVELEKLGLKNEPHLVEVP